MILDQPANVLEYKTEPAKKPYQRALHDSTAVVDLLVSADLNRPPNAELLAEFGDGLIG